MKRLILFICTMSLLPISSKAQTVDVHIAAPQLQGSRALEPQTEIAVLRDYLKAWTVLTQAFDHNNASTLSSDFVGVALDRLSDTVEGQVRDGIHTTYTDLSHDVQVIFYSPEGLSIEMTDIVRYKQVTFLGGKQLSTAVVKQSYIIVMTPSESRWQVRVFQATRNQ